MSKNRCCDPEMVLIDDRSKNGVALREKRGLNMCDVSSGGQRDVSTLCLHR